MRIHILKTWPNEFTASMFGNKSFEVRVNDRDFKVGDYLQLREWNPEKEFFTGRVLTRHITYILEGGKFGLPENVVAMSVVLV